jgi:AsmA protein
MKLFKIIALIVGILLLLALVPIAVLLSIDINNYKDLLAQTVEKQTGRKLYIQGPIDKSFFPWLGAHVGALQFSNAAGFDETPMAQLQEVQVRIKLLPLFKKELVVDKLVVHGLKLHFARNAQGVSNWDDLIAQRETPTPAEPPPEVPKSPAPAAPLRQQIAAFYIGGIDIQDATVVWDDRQAQARYELSELNVQTGELQLGQAFNTKLGFRFNVAQPEMQNALLQGEVQWSARIDAQLQTQQYRLQDIHLDADIGGTLLPVPQLALTLAAQVDSDLKNQTASVSQLKLVTLGSELSGSAQAQHILAEPMVDSQLQWRVNDAQALVNGVQSLLPPAIKASLLQDASVQLKARLAMAEQSAQVKPITVSLGELSLQAALKAKQIVDNPQFNGSLEVAAFNPRPLLQDMIGELPKLADDEALTQVALSTEFHGTPDSLSLKSLAVAVDDTNITGSTGVSQFDDPSIEFALNVDAVDVDRYLPPPESAQPPASQPASAKPVASAATAEEEIPLPVDLLSRLNLQGELNVGRLKAMQVELAQLKLGVHAADGVLRADPVQAQLYQGTSTTRLTLDVRQEKPRYTIAEVLKGVEFGPLVKQLMKDDYVSGIANLQANITTQGSRVSELKQQLNGTFGFDFANGVVKYLDLADIVVADYAKYLRKALPKDDSGKTTAFRVLKGTANIKDGVVSNNDLYLQSARFEVFGEGSVDVAKETIGYTANTQIHNPTNKMIQYELDKLAGIPIPVYFRGTFAEPEYSVDWEGTLRTVAKQRIKQEQEKLKQKAKQKLKEEQQKLKDKADQEKEEELRKLEEKLKVEQQKLKDKADEKKQEELRKLKEKFEKLF